jgi:hypothetical protein
MKKDAVLFSLFVFILTAGVVGSDLLAHCRHDASCSAQLGLPAPSANSLQEMALIKE